MAPQEIPGSDSPHKCRHPALGCPICRTVRQALDIIYRKAHTSAGYLHRRPSTHTHTHCTHTRAGDDDEQIVPAGMQLRTKNEIVQPVLPVPDVAAIEGDIEKLGLISAVVDDTVVCHFAHSRISCNTSSDFLPTEALYVFACYLCVVCMYVCIYV